MTDEIITSGKQFADFAQDLTDEEITRTVRVINDVRTRYATKTATTENLEALRDEILTRLAEFNVLAELDVSPVFNGEPPIVEIKGKVGVDPIYKYGFDHEKKRHEVLKSKERGEDYLGQKEPVNKKKNRRKRKRRKDGDS